MPFRTFITANYTFDFYGSNTSRSQPTIEKRSQKTNSVFSSIYASNTYQRTVVSPNYQIGIAWSPQTKCMLYNLTSMAVIGYHFPESSPNSLSTNTITFSQDSGYAVIETDNFNPIVILDLSNLTVVKNITVQDTINEAFFLDSMANILVVSGQNALIFVNLTSNEQFSTPPLRGLSANDQQNNIFSCYNN